MARPASGTLNRGQRHAPWRYGPKRVKTYQNFVLHPKVPLDIQAPNKVYSDEQRALPRNMPHDILGPLFEENHPVLTDGTFHSFLSAFNKRCNYFTDAQADKSIIKASKRFLKQLVPEPLPVVEWTKELFDSWVTQFPLPKQGRLKKSVERLELYRQVEFAAKDVFEKVELLMKRHDPEWAGRIVNASSDLHNAITGPVMAECLKRLVAASAVNADSDPRVSVRIAYGNSPQTFVKDLEGDGPFIEADFSSNDKLQVKNVSQLEYEWSLRLGMPEWLASIIRASTVYTARSRRHGVMARLKYQLPSGATSTTFRNSIWNGSIFYAWAKRFGLRIKAVILGDDMLARVTNGRIPKRARRDYEHFARLACMKAKVKVSEALVDCEFLSRRFVPTVVGHLMFPKVGKALGRFNARSNNSNIDDNSYIAGKALSYAYEFRHYKPAMALFLERFLATGKSMHALDASLFSFAVREQFDRLGGRSELIQFMKDVPTANDDEFMQYVHYVYGVFRTDFMSDLEDMLFGDEDLSIVRAAPYLARDVW